MTRADCASGTDRIAEVARTTGDVDIFVNVQADEPEIDPNVIDLVAARLIDDDTADMATAGTPIRSEQLLNDPSCVKIVMAWETDSKSRAGKGRAVYFSRATVPFVRDGVRQCHFNTEPPLFWHHIGLYAYRRDFLEWFAEAPPGALEQAEKLEQLRAIEAGKRIVVERVESATPGIDTEADLDAFTKRLEKTPKT